MTDKEMTEWWKDQAEKHCQYTQGSLATANDKSVNYSLECVMFHYKAALIHGFKHGIEKAKDERTQNAPMYDPEDVAFDSKDSRLDDIDVMNVTDAVLSELEVPRQYKKEQKHD